MGHILYISHNVRTRTFGFLIVVRFNDTPTLLGHFVSSPREREKIDRIDSRRDEREGQGRKTNRNESEETKEIKAFPLDPYLLQGQQALPNCKPVSAGHPGDVRYIPPSHHHHHHVPLDMCSGKIRINLCIRTVPSDSSLGAFWTARDARFSQVDKENTKQTARMCRLILVVIGHMCQKVLFSHVTADFKPLILEFQSELFHP